MRYPGFWAVADAKRRLGWRYWGMSSWFDSSLDLKGKLWRYLMLIDVGNDQKRAKAVVSLAPTQRPKKGAFQQETKLRGEGGAKDVVAALIRRLRQPPGKDWRLDHLDIRGNSKRIRVGGVSWVLHVGLYWFRREGSPCSSISPAAPLPLLRRNRSTNAP